MGGGGRQMGNSGEGRNFDEGRSGANLLNSDFDNSNLFQS